jgi:predicted ATPase with chaperone activity
MPVSIRSSQILARVEKAHQVQGQRFSSIEAGNHVFCNSDIRPAEVRNYCMLDDTSMG